MKKFLLCFALALFLFLPVTYAETTTEDVVEALKMAFADGFDYCDLRYNDNTLYVDVAIDGFAQSLYEAKENGIDSANETWNQIKGMFLTIHYSCEAMFETCNVTAPDNILLQLWNDDVVIRDDHSTGKSRILLAIHNGMFYIDEMEAHSETEQATRSIPAKETESAYTLNTNSKKFHIPSCDSAARTKEKNKKEYEGDREELIEMGYTPCGVCHP